MTLHSEDFYATRDHVVTFMNKFSKLHPDKQDLDLAEKLDVYRKDFPDYDCWAQSIFVGFNSKSTDETDQNYLKDTSGTYVSLGGKIEKTWGKGGPISITPVHGDGRNRYPRTAINGNLTVPFHRLLACTFIKRAGLSDTPFHRLEVNHKNGITTDFSLGNLEWVTSKGNVDHAYETGLMKAAIYKMTLNREVKGYPAGSEFFFRKEDLTKHKIAPSSPLRYLAGIVEESYSSSWSVHSENIVSSERGLPDDLKAHDLLPVKKGFVLHHPDGDRYITWRDLKPFKVKHDRLDRAIENNWRVLGFLWSAGSEEHEKNLPKGFPSAMTYEAKKEFVYVGVTKEGKRFTFTGKKELEAAGCNPTVVRAGIRLNTSYYGLTWSREYV